jgi:1-deoxy-D-xylulose-5-phosphate reductoisomerase
MNKGLELIEAHHLFAFDPKRLDVLVHPQSIVHALVTYRDGSVVAGLSVPDMRIPIAHCLGWPGRLAWDAPKLDLAARGFPDLRAAGSGAFSGPFARPRGA